jgi:hypothetical protein
MFHLKFLLLENKVAHLVLFLGGEGKADDKYNSSISNSKRPKGPNGT